MYWRIDSRAGMIGLVLTEPPTGNEYFVKAANFNGDLILTNTTDRSVLNGTWELTRDGAYLILHVQKNAQTVNTKVIELVSVDHKTLCLKHTTKYTTAVFLEKQ